MGLGGSSLVFRPRAVDRAPEPFDLIGAQDLLVGLLLRRIAASAEEPDSRHELETLIGAMIEKAARRVGYKLPSKESPST